MSPEAPPADAPSADAPTAPSAIDDGFEATSPSKRAESRPSIPSTIGLMPRSWGCPSPPACASMINSVVSCGVGGRAAASVIRPCASRGTRCLATREAVAAAAALSSWANFCSQVRARGLRALEPREPRFRLRGCGCVVSLSAMGLVMRVQIVLTEKVDFDGFLCSAFRRPPRRDLRNRAKKQKLLYSLPQRRF